VRDAETSVLPLLAQGIKKRCTRRIAGDTPASAYCWNALNTLGAFETAAAFAAAIVVEVMAAHETGLGLQTTAITAAGNIGPAAKDAVPYMILALKHPDSYVRQESIQALERIGPAAAAAIPALEELRLSNPGYHRSAEIDKALASIRGSGTPRP
jgi:HEAT repeat protein